MASRAPSAPALEPTARQLLVLGVAVLHGRKEAAHRLEISESTVHATIRAGRERVGVNTTEQLVYLCAARGWLRIAGLGRARGTHTKRQVAIRV